MQPAGKPERRTDPRQPAGSRLFASIDGQTVLLLNISRSGIAMRAHGLHVGSSHVLELHLDHRHLLVTVEILDVSEQQLRARFVDLSEQATASIDAFIAGD